MESKQRQVAYKVPISAILNNPYIEQEGWNPNYVQVNGRQISRINLVATVIDKQNTGSLATLVLDDSTGVIQARLFNEDVKKIENISVGDTILIIGRPRKFNDQKFITIEISKKIDSVWAKIRKIELQKEFDLYSQNGEDKKEVQESKQHLNQYGVKFLELIKENDNGSGADVDKIISSSNLKEEEAQEVLTELIKLGEIYEPRPNKVRILG